MTNETNIEFTIEEDSVEEEISTEERDYRQTIANKMMESFSMILWEPRDAFSMPELISCCVLDVVPVNLDDGDWTLFIEVGDSMTNQASQNIPLTDFLASFIPIGPLVFRHCNA